MEMTVPAPPASASTEELHQLIADSVASHEAAPNEAVAAVLDTPQVGDGNGAPTTTTETTSQTETEDAAEPPAPRLSDDDTQLQLMGLTAADLDHAASDPFLSSGLAAPLELEKLEPEVLQWMEQCRVANHEQLQGDGMARVFTWLHRFLPRVAGGHPRFPEELKVTAAQIVTSIDVNNKNNAETLATIATEFGLKSSTTLLFWKRQNDERMLKELAQDSTATDFAHGRTTAVLSVWVSRFLKRHLPNESIAHVEAEPGLDASRTPVEDSESNTVNQVETSQSPATDSCDVPSKRAAEPASTAVETTTERPRKKRTKRTSPEGYVLHSNEFKLNALKKLDEGKTISEVAEELGLKCTNTLVYWNSIRDKLAVADKKRFRLAGGGRRSTCTFEGELMTWISDRQQKGIGTDVRAVLAYMREFHPSFTEGKKEPTLRKWILRFFQRWRQQSICTGASGDDDAGEAAHHDEDDDEELRKSTGILV
ncbi:hypothetical protein PINS_up004720 [Pythium insidiosum]|nr:hypothetical protein PINS_up004720 [Pythium insidiosum]